MTVKLLLDELAFIIVNRLDINDTNNHFKYTKCYEELMEEPLFNDIKDLNVFYTEIVKHDDHIVGLSNYFINRVRLEMAIKHLLKGRITRDNLGFFFSIRNEFIRVSKVFNSRNLEIANLYLKDVGTLSYTKGDIIDENPKEKFFHNMEEYAFLLVNRGNPLYPPTTEKYIQEISLLYYKECGFKHEPYIREFYLNNIAFDKSQNSKLLYTLINVYMLFDLIIENGLADEDMVGQLVNAIKNYQEVVQEFLNDELTIKSR